MKVVKAHNMTREAARRKVDSDFPKLMASFDNTVSDVTYSWEDDLMAFSFRARGLEFKGTLSVTDTELNIDLDIPLMLQAFQGLVQERLEEGLDEFLET